MLVRRCRAPVARRLQSADLHGAAGKVQLNVEEKLAGPMTVPNSPFTDNTVSERGKDEKYRAPALRGIMFRRRMRRGVVRRYNTVMERFQQFPAFPCTPA